MMGSPQCGCGKTMHPPYCDGSHARNDKQYREWQDKITTERQSENGNKESSSKDSSN